ncbi:MAG: branched-chain amino acid ABC transporter permease, partial [Hyphomicrobiales bacterium]|nr:branched-chain amino acid ABC transporter permease [Hyphomicrobiales bacterium]
GVILALNLIESPTGRAMRAIHDSEIASLVAGIDVASYKLKIFVVSAVYASIAGSLLAFLNGHITPDGTAGFLRSVELVTMVVLGGLGSVIGAITGAAVLVILPQALTIFHDYEHLMLGLMIMASMILLPRGIIPSLLARMRGGKS